MRKQDLSNYKLPLNWERGNNIIFEAIWVVLFRPIVSSFLPGSYWRKIVLMDFFMDSVLNIMNSSYSLFCCSIL